MIKANILIVEDERIVARDLQCTLERAGYVVLGTAASAPQAVELAAQTRPDLILMDVMLADNTSGITAATEIRAQREVAIVYLTANSDQAVLQRAKSTEPIAFILKPYDEPELLAAIEIALHQYQTQQLRTLDYQRQLQKLMAELSVAEERERQRIATDIHDRISQTLAVCQMRVEALAQAVSSPAHTAELEQISQLLDRTLHDTSSLIFELSPPILHQLGLAPALEWFGERLQQEHGLRFELIQPNSVPNLDNDRRTALFRAACELMNNVVKHARASLLRVQLRNGDQTIELLVEDDGIGFDLEAALARKRDHGGFGLFHVRERLRAWGGNLLISPAPDGGTRAILQLPPSNTKNL
jgi:signal transduction histidine kinase